MPTLGKSNKLIGDYPTVQCTVKTSHHITTTAVQLGFLAHLASGGLIVLCRSTPVVFLTKC